MQAAPANAATRGDSTVSRSGVATTVVNRAAAAPVSASRANASAVSARVAAAPRISTAPVQSRAGIVPRSAQISRAVLPSASIALGDGYNVCRDSYFTCMDQFCATADDDYRRCICSSRLDAIKKKELALANTTGSLKDFQDLNMDVISKSTADVKAMLKASDGEKIATTKKDTSESAQKLAGISSVLNSAKNTALSTGGKLDIAGSINQIFNASDLIGGVDISGLSGARLYNAVHGQCAEFAKNACATNSIMNMAVSAYGMYIENDCSLMSNNLAAKQIAAAGAIRQQEAAMHEERLANYDSHNSSGINDCVAAVRKDITGESACGPNFVHCLDVTGRFLNKDTGEPIYTADFYKLERATTLDANDVLIAQENRLLVSQLQKQKDFAKKSLDTCRDLSKDVWEEFLRQAVTEIYQAQQARIAQVKDECMVVINECYNTQLSQLKDFSNVDKNKLLGMRIELSEDLCQTRLDTCALVYTGGAPGLTELRDALYNYNSLQIADTCKTTVGNYASELCRPLSSDTLHKYPYGCRMYRRGMYSKANGCRGKTVVITQSQSGDGGSGGATPPVDPVPPPSGGYQCTMCYTSCNPGYQFADASAACKQCVPADVMAQLEECSDYSGSLYEMLVNYAVNMCVRPSLQTDLETVPENILADINSVMDSLSVNMTVILRTECEGMGGTWKDNKSSATPEPARLNSYEKNVNSNDDWGYCYNP